MIQIESKPIEFFADKIANDEQFSLMRWGDGEMSALLGRPIGQTDANGHVYFPLLCKDLRQVLDQRILEPEKFDYMLAMQSLGYNLLGAEWDAYIDVFKAEPLQYVWSDVLMHAICQLEPPGLLPLIKAMNKRDVIMVGPKFLEKLLPFRVAQFVNVPERNCYLSLQEIVNNVTHEAIKYKRPFIALSCGMATKILLHCIYPYFKKWGGSIFDFGSLWDPFAGRASRSCYNDLPAGLTYLYLREL